MPLTPIDIQQKTFGPELRGYNMDEVDDFLDEVVTTLKDYDQQIRDAQDRIRALEAEVATRGEDESAISRALVQAQKQADALVAEAQGEADRIRDQARDETAQLRSERDAEQMALTQEIARMRATVADLKRRVVELAATAQADLDRMDEAAGGASEAVTASMESEPSEPTHKPWEVAEAATGDHVAPDFPSVADGMEEAGVADEFTVEGEYASDDRGVEVGDELDLDEMEDLGEADDADSGDDEEELEATDYYGESPGERMGEHEAPSSPDDPDAAPSSSRRPWERGSV